VARDAENRNEVVAGPGTPDPVMQAQAFENGRCYIWRVQNQI